jgi:ABC-type multidrug transport system permease subunit
VSLATQVISPFIVLFAPVYLPIEKLPFFFQFTSRFIPTTYSARAMRVTMGYGDFSTFWIGYLDFAGIFVLCLYGAVRKRSGEHEQ